MLHVACCMMILTRHATCNTLFNIIPDDSGRAILVSKELCDVPASNQKVIKESI